MREVGSRECNDNERWRVGICLDFGVLCKKRRNFAAKRSDLAH